MVAVALTDGEKVHCDCPRYHNGLISIRTRRRHREEAGMINPLNDSTLQSQFQLNTLRNDGFLPGVSSPRPQITATTIPKETDKEHAPPGNDFDDWSMDINGEGDGGFFNSERSQTTSEDEEDVDESHEQDVKDELQKLTIDSGEESAFEDEDGEEGTDEELEDLDDRMHGGTDDNDADSLKLLLLQLKELSGISRQGFKAYTLQ
jgi:hypothetical protein